MLQTDAARWEQSEQQWWQSTYAAARPRPAYTGTPARPKGFRQFWRERLFRHVRPHLAGQTWIDIGAGDSWTVADLMHPTRYHYTYIATDISSAGLLTGRQRAASLPVVSASSGVPFAPNSAFVVSGLGVLHHFPDWRQPLVEMMDLLQPGGYLILNEAIDKPRIGNRQHEWNHANHSPHEGKVNGRALLAQIEARCDILESFYTTGLLHVVLSHFLGTAKLAQHSHTLTRLLHNLDQGWLATVSHLHPTLAPHEVALIARKR